MSTENDVVVATGAFVVKHKMVGWKPKEDITTYELAQAVPVFTYSPDWVATYVETLPENVRRHFELKDM